MQNLQRSDEGLAFWQHQALSYETALLAENRLQHPVQGIDVYPPIERLRFESREGNLCLYLSCLN